MSPYKCNVLVRVYSRILRRQLSHDVPPYSLISHSNICIDEYNSARLIVRVSNDECSATLAHVQTGADLTERRITHKVNLYNRPERR